ncbi:hypothetical protein H2202_011176 [Exophiala xenobiotica]|nr:hypothetical protein H2202_011176 [Exophiala xenobiotica]
MVAPRAGQDTDKMLNAREDLFDNNSIAEENMSSMLYSIGQRLRSEGLLGWELGISLLKSCVMSSSERGGQLLQMQTPIADT